MSKNHNRRIFACKMGYGYKETTWVVTIGACYAHIFDSINKLQITTGKLQVLMND